jgi:hypothetical protein
MRQKKSPGASALQTVIWLGIVAFILVRVIFGS